MSHWWTDRTRVVILQDRVAVARLRYRIQPRALESFVLPIGEGTPSLGRTLDVLDTALKRIPAGSHLAVVLSNALVRTTVVPWQSTVLRHDERLGLARHCLKLKFGDDVSGSRVVVASPRFGQSSVSCALDQGLLAEIEKRASTHKHSITSVEPLLMTAFNAHAGRVTRSDAVLAILEAGWVTLVVVVRGEIKHLVTRRIESTGEASLGPILRQEIATLDSPFDPPRVFLFSAHTNLAAPMHLQWPTERLTHRIMPGFDARTHAGSHIALCGA